MADSSVLNHFIMLKIYRLCKSPQYHRRGFRSLNHIAKTLENSINPSVTTKRVLSEMMDKKLLVIDERNLVDLDESAFERYIEHTEFGAVVLGYADDVSVIRFPSR